MAIVENESDLMMGWLMIRTFYNSPSVEDYPGKADALIRLKKSMRKFMRWFKLTRRRGHWFAYHSIGRDV